MKRAVTHATAAIPVKAIIGIGIFISTMKGAVACAKRPNRLQMPKQVPASRTGNTQGVAI